MIAADVMEALHKRWPYGDYVTLEQAPDGPSRLGRKVDFLAISAWKSRGYEVDAVEVKVTYSDWKRERDGYTNPRRPHQRQGGPAKADWWWRHSHRFWIAAPAPLAERIRDELPETWGLLAVADTGTMTTVVQATKRKAEPFTWAECIGLLRASANAGTAALERARSDGYRNGRADGEARVSESATADALADLRGRVAAAEEALGVPIARFHPREWGWMSSEEFLAALREFTRDVQTAARARRDLASVREQAQRVVAAIDQAMA